MSNDATPQIDGFSDLVPIGRGGFSTVYSATQSGIERRVAIKVLDLGFSDVRRFERECRTLGTLSGVRGIVPVLQATFSVSGQPCIVMQLMDGGSLGDRLRASGSMSSDETARQGVVLCGALQTAHDARIFHRDIKPENVLFHGQDAAIADFGIALVNDVESRSQTIDSISPPHAPPERFLEIATDPVPGDVYSLGSTLYTALAGRPPFGTAAQGGLAGLIQRVTTTQLPSIDQPGLSSALMATLARAMEKEPAGRYASMDEFGAALSSALVAVEVDESTVPRPPTRPVAIATVPGPSALVDPGVADPPATIIRPRAAEPLTPHAAPEQWPSAEPPWAAPTHVAAPTGPRTERRRTARGLWVAAAALFILALAGGAFLVGRTTFGADTASAVIESSTTTPTSTSATSTVAATSTTLAPAPVATVAAATTVSTPPAPPTTRRPTATTTRPPPVALPISEATTAVDRYLAAASGTDEEFFASVWSYPIEQHYVNTDVSETALREATRKYWEKYADIKFVRAGATEVSEVDGGWRTVTPFEFSMFQVSDGAPRCGLHAITLEFDHDWLIHKASESNLRPDGC